MLLLLIFRCVCAYMWRPERVRSLKPLIGAGNKLCSFVVGSGWATSPATVTDFSIKSAGCLYGSARAERACQKSLTSSTQMMMYFVSHKYAIQVGTKIMFS